MAREMLAKVSYEQGEIIFMEGDLGEATYLVQSGSVELVKKDSDGFFETIGTRLPGQVFGELALLTDRPRAAGARAAEDCVLIAVERYQLDQKLEAADPFVRALFRILAQNLLSVMDKKAAFDNDSRDEDMAALSGE